MGPCLHGKRLSDKAFANSRLVQIVPSRCAHAQAHRLSARSADRKSCCACHLCSKLHSHALPAHVWKCAARAHACTLAGNVLPHAVQTECLQNCSRAPRQAARPHLQLLL
eukprot:2016700-Alexandrium_andersonii.AAC.1